MRNILAALLLCVLSIPAIAIADDATDVCFNFLQAQDYPRAIGQAQNILQKDKSSRRAWLCLGRAQYETGNLKAALPALLEVEKRSGSKRELATAAGWLGLVYDDMGRRDEALQQHSRALALNRELGDKGGEATALNNLASSYNGKGEPERALEAYRQSLELAENDAKKASTWNNMALIHAARGDYPKAIELLQQVLEASRRTGDYQSVAHFQLNLGDTYRRARDYAQAEKLLAEGLEGARRIGDRGWLATGYAFQGRLKRSQGDIPAARALLTQAMKLHEELGAKEEVLTIQQELAGMGSLVLAK